MQVARPFIFISDLDGTLLPNQPSPAPDGCLQRTTDMLFSLIDNEIAVAYCTGRHLTLAQTVLEEYGLPRPTYWLCNVGTEIYFSNGSSDKQWESLIGQPLNQADIYTALAQWPMLVPQESKRNGPYKVSFSTDYSPSPSDVVQWQQAVAAVIPNIKLVISLEPSTGTTLLDFIANHTGKAEACHYLRSKHEFDLTDVFFSGDSGNDLDALQAGFCGTLVANAEPDVKQSIMHGGGKHFISTHPYGDGVLDGLKHFKFITE